MEDCILNYNKLGMDLLSKENYNNSIFYLNKALAKIPNLPSDDQKAKLLTITYNNIGCYFKRIGSHKKALEYLYKAAEMGKYRGVDLPNVVSSHLNICSILSETGDHEKALRHSTKAIFMLRDGRNDFQLLKSLIIAYYKCGVEYRYLEHLQDAMDCFLRGYKLANEHLDYGNNLTISLKKSYEELLGSAVSHQSLELRRVSRASNPSRQGLLRISSFKKPRKNSHSITKKNEIKNRHRFAHGDFRSNPNIRTKLPSAKKKSFKKSASRKSSLGTPYANTKNRPRNLHSFLNQKIAPIKRHKASAVIQNWWRNLKNKPINLSKKPSSSAITSTASRKSSVVYPKKHKLLPVRDKYDRSKLVKLQSFCRMLPHFRRFKTLKNRVIRIQAYWRMWRIRNLYLKIYNAIRYIQLSYKLYKKQKTLSNFKIFTP